MKVYLSGPIFQNDKEATEGWRKYVSGKLGGHGIMVIDPCRGKPTYESASFTPNEILFRDLEDVNQANLILVNLNELEHHMEKLPIGTICECMVSWLWKKPVVIVANDPRVVEHPWMKALSVRVFSEVDDALNYILGFWR